MRFLSAFLLASALAAPAFAEVDAKALWGKKCASCHGETGDAKTKMGAKHHIPDLTTAKWHAHKKHDDAFIKDVITNGIMENGKMTKMGPYKEKLTAEEIDALVAYVKTLEKK